MISWHEIRGFASNELSTNVFIHMQQTKLIKVFKVGMSPEYLDAARRSLVAEFRQIPHHLRPPPNTVFGESEFSAVLGQIDCL